MKALVALAILAAMPVGAQVTYDYAGQAMTLTGVAGSASIGSQTYTMSYSSLGDVVLAQALNPNQANQQVVPLAYAFNDPGLLPPGTGLNIVSGLLNYNVNDPYSSPLTPVGPNPDPWGGGIPTLDFSTANGKITSFGMTFGGSFPYGRETLTLSSAGDSYNSNVSVPDCNCGGNWSGSNSVGGTWAQVPEISAGVAATALSLLFGAALVLKGRRRTSLS
jgi:hypothetical protein